MASNNSTVPTTQQSSEQPSSSPVTIPSSSQQQPSSTPPPSSSDVPASETPSPSETQVVTAPSPDPTTIVRTSVVTTASNGEPSTVLVTITSAPSNTAPPTSAGQSSAPTSSSSSPAGLQDIKNNGKSGGLDTGAKTAIAVVVPVVVVGLLVLAGIILWRKRKQRKTAEEARRKEVEEYGFNPNNDPTLPAVGMASEMAEDQSGYRGWGNTQTSSNRKASTTLTSGMTYSDSNSNPGGYQSPGSPTQAHSDSLSNDPLMNGRREELDSEGIGALGAAPAANQNQASVHRGPSNASSSYSAANRSDNSGDYPIPVSNPQDYYDNNGYYQANPYNDGYGGGQQPIIRDVSARRNTRIENPSVFPQQGNSGIAQNF